MDVHLLKHIPGRNFIMRINHNIAALNTHRQLSQANNANQNSMEKLSSGLRINRAGDDAAGLAISEKMRGQIRGLEQSQRNAQDGISMIQTGEGALNESHSILQRMRELAVQSSNDTNTTEDRAELQKEVDQLSQELTRVSENTEFNTQNLLDGSFEGTFQIGANKGQNIDISINSMDAKSLGVAGADGIETEVTTGTIDALASDGNAQADDTAEVFGAFGNSSGATTHESAPSSVTAKKLSEETTVTDGSNSVDANYALYNENDEVLAVSNDGQSYTVLESATEESSLGSASILQDGSDNAIEFDFGSDAKVTTGELTVNFTDNGSDAADTLSLTAEATVSFNSDSEGLASGSYSVVDNSHPSVSNLGIVNGDNEVVALSSDGQDWNDMFGENLFDIPGGGGNALSAGDSLEISSSGGIDISTQEAADNAIETINEAITSVSSERSKLGAYQNRLEHTINNLGTSAENLTAAESRIRDVDYASAA